MSIDKAFDQLAKERDVQERVIWAHPSTSTDALQFEIWGTSEPLVFKLSVIHPELEPRFGGKTLNLDGRSPIAERFSLSKDDHRSAVKALRKFTQNLVKISKNQVYSAFSKDDLDMAIESVLDQAFLLEK